MDYLSIDQRKFLVKVFQKDPDYHKRVKAHIPVLFDDDFKESAISRIYDLSIPEIRILLKFVYYFGLDDYFKLDINQISRNVANEDYRIEKSKIRKRGNGLLKFLLWPFRALYSFINNLSEILMMMLGYLHTFFLPKRYQSTKIENTNIARIDHGSSKNFIMQIGNVNVYTSQEEVDPDGENDTDKESIVTDSKAVIVEKVIDLIKSGKKYDFGNERANMLFNKAQAIQNDETIYQEEKLNRIRLYAIMIVGILLYSSTFKGGLSSIGFFGITIMVSIRACYPSHDLIKSPFEEKKQNIERVDSIQELSQDGDEALTTKIIENSITYKRQVPKYYDLDSECFSLSAMGKKQRDFITNFDRVNHYSQDYFIGIPDQKYYVHVVSYSNVGEAAFQMHHINDRTEFKAKILRVSNLNKVLYTVVIGQFNGDEVEEMCSLIESWKAKCLSSEVDIGCYFNG